MLRYLLTYYKGALKLAKIAEKTLALMGYGVAFEMTFM